MTKALWSVFLVGCLEQPPRETTPSAPAYYGNPCASSPTAGGCTKGCRCGNSCIDCSKTCRGGSTYRKRRK